MMTKVVLRSGAFMHEVEPETVALVLTGPPYWPPELEPKLKHPPVRRERVDALAEGLLAFAASLLPVFQECFRVLRPGAALVMQTRDLRLGDRLVGVAGAHRQLAEQAGFDLFTRYLWLPERLEPDRRREALLAQRRGRPRPSDAEEFLVFLKPGHHPTQVSPQAADLAALLHPLLQTKRGRIGKPHRHQAPVPVCELFVHAFTQVGDLVVDPFAGHGTSLVVAQRLERNVLGYVLEPDCLTAVQHNLGTRWKARSSSSDLKSHLRPAPEPAR